MPAQTTSPTTSSTVCYFLPATRQSKCKANAYLSYRTGSWTQSLKPGNPQNVSWLNSNQTSVREDLKYSNEDIEHIVEWVKRHCETTWHSLGTCSMAPREGNDIVKHGVLDERLNVHGVKGLKVADLSICPDNVGWYVLAYMDYVKNC